jgi:hypothetical protein
LKSFPWKIEARASPGSHSSGYFITIGAWKPNDTRPI